MKRRSRRGTAWQVTRKGDGVDDALSEADGRGVGRIDGQTDVPHPNTYGTYDVELLQWGHFRNVGLAGIPAHGGNFTTYRVTE